MDKNPALSKTNNKRKGTLGEDLAAEYLVEKGYVIEHRNWKGYKHEIDIIASLNGMIIFVEVKLRTDDSYGWPEKAVNRLKISHIASAANEFLDQFPNDNEIRFDIVSITINTQATDIYHIEDAFVP